ncbi:hypothetical protein B0O80DRAFT_445659 [Mortierella sp. GBAus27b]|nr:hypothetical protein BGX31_004764 [Mortierella sp. GBA43]KAI8357714.1 hypothetical protein B0O80DRAFT_445659 [Mortierella sp. GBAus27b]
MSSCISRALALPEILHAIALRIPIFEHDAQPMPSFVDDEERGPYFAPHHLRTCTLVSRFWNTIFTPYLYSCYVDDNSTGVSENKPDRLEAFRRHNHYFRRFFSSYNSAAAETPLSFDIDNPPRNLLGLYLLSTDGPVGNLLISNQGSQLRQLTWNQQWPPREVEQGHRDALANLPCLEALDLKMWKMDNQLMYRILNGCRKTLRTLRLESVKGYDENLFHWKGDGDGDGSALVLPNVKSLDILLGWEDSRSVVLMPRLFPGLETIQIMGDMEEHPIEDLARALRENCPKLNTIEYKEGYSMAYETGYFPEPEVYASLIKDSFSGPGLERAKLGIPSKLDDHMTEALVFHATTLVALHMQFRVNYSSWGGSIDHTSGLDRVFPVLTLLGQCVKLKELRLSDVSLPVQYLEPLLSGPWKCRDLEQLIIESYRSSNSSSLKTEAERVAWNAMSYKIRFYEYMNDGQGWFLKSGLGREAILEALTDNDWKRRLFSHMYSEDVKNVKYVRLRTAEFFAEEQPLEIPEVD